LLCDLPPQIHRATSSSTDAQRESCEAYIKSQAHEGWRLVRAQYDDGSGASLDRPALHQLLHHVGSGKIDVIDRLAPVLAAA
jgi:site-specific DNA recombinase